MEEVLEIFHNSNLKINNLYKFWSMGLYDRFTRFLQHFTVYTHRLQTINMYFIFRIFAMVLKAINKKKWNKAIQKEKMPFSNYARLKIV